MWFRLGLMGYIAKKFDRGDGCDFFISDFQNVWHDSLSNDELVSVAQKLNPLFEAPVKKLRDLCVNLYDGDEKIQKEIEVKDGTLLVKLQSLRMGVKFQFHVALNLGDSKMLYNEFILPLLLTIVKMDFREKKLIEFVKTKEAEINDLRQEYLAEEPSTQLFSEDKIEDQELINPTLNSVTNDPSLFLHYINKRLFFKPKPKPELEDSEIKEKNIKNDIVSNKSQLLFKDHVTNVKNSVEVSLNLHHEKMKKQKLSKICKIKI